MTVRRRPSLPPTPDAPRPGTGGASVGGSEGVESWRRYRRRRRWRKALDWALTLEQLLLPFASPDQQLRALRPVVLPL